MLSRMIFNKGFLLTYNYDWTVSAPVQFFSASIQWDGLMFIRVSKHIFVDVLAQLGPSSGFTCVVYMQKKVDECVFANYTLRDT